MTDSRLTIFRRWLNAPLFNYPTPSDEWKSRARTIGNAVFAVILSVGAFVLIVQGVEALKANGLLWLTIGVAAVASFFGSPFAIPVLLLLILFALWSRNAKLDDLKEQISELSERVDELEDGSPKRLSPPEDNDP